MVGAFLIAFAAEMVQYGRAKVRKNLKGAWVETRRGRMAKASIEALLFGVQVTNLPQPVVDREWLKLADMCMDSHLVGGVYRERCG